MSDVSYYTIDGLKKLKDELNHLKDWVVGCVNFKAGEPHDEKSITITSWM